MGKYPAITEDVSEEELAYGFIDNIGKKRAYKQESHVHVVH